MHILLQHYAHALNRLLYGAAYLRYNSVFVVRCVHSKCLDDGEKAFGHPAASTGCHTSTCSLKSNARTTLLLAAMPRPNTHSAKSDPTCQTCEVRSAGCWRWHHQITGLHYHIYRIYMQGTTYRLKYHSGSIISY